ncbi:MAG: bifunctional diaminohydroxyphosphoribosylaminopyrimidine deaminase/5-amino-6-(5-phosphoribosylamino)uracil reductase RibD [Xanthomonadaceae bacterium]|nr:bifunctional diaminohydroxyphosphoribosylaminopyrimidine deaminase/5-amino-6-(5-phosphoribosylamino)uracil reductase RibD [Xanthomonadaceae bacterium]
MTDFTTEDQRWMARALELAEQGAYTADPNPLVGCVLVRNGEVVGEGWHRQAGTPHAEIHALAAAGDAARGATAYLNLEPCAHQGRTGPCAQALVQAGVARVVAAIVDPNPLVSGKGLAVLEQAGIQTGYGLLAAEAAALNRGFLKRHTENRPWFTVKCAASLDGRTALASGESRWISSKDSRTEVQHMRARASAILTGIGTVLADDPRLTVRMEGEWRQPARIVLDPSLRCPPDAKLFAEGGAVFVVTAHDDFERVRRLSQAGATVVRLPKLADGRIDLNAVAGWLAAQDFNEVLVEAGATLNGALLDAGMIDELVIYLAPMLLGSSARALFAMPPLPHMSAGRRLDISDVRQVGDDWRITAAVR